MIRSIFIAGINKRNTKQPTNYLGVRSFLFIFASFPFQIQMLSTQNHVNLVVRHYIHTYRLIFECLHRLNDCVAQFYLDMIHPVNYNKNFVNSNLSRLGYKIVYQWNNSCFGFVLRERIGAVM